MTELTNAEKEESINKMLSEMRELKAGIDKVQQDIDIQVSNIKDYTKTTQQLTAYQIAVNQLDDFFEYMNESKSDRAQVHQILDNLTKKLKIICSQKTLN